MSCCSPKLREAVKEQEAKVNEKGKDSLPLFVKLLAVILTVGAIVVGVLM